ncbi:flagellin [Clostridium neuense]|uniref:Flagellin n=1 Tax=Clostridium neuense TaxID=1728934 RepID=A0ABW8THY3_9CLOT
MIVGHNMASFNIFTKYKSALAAQTKAMAHISSGLRVNDAGDDPYALARNENFNMQIRSLQRANSNSQDAVSLIQTVDSALDGITSILQRIKDLAVQNSNGTYNVEDRDASQLEVSNLINEVDHLAKSTNMNDVNLLTNPSGSFKCMVGGNVGENIDIPTFDFQAASIKDKDGTPLTSVDVTTQDGCKKAMNLVDSALDTVDKARGTYGALQNRLNSTISNVSDISSETEAGDSQIMDVDIASEMIEYSKNSIIVQAGTAMMAQTNKFPQQVLQILQNVR